MTALLLLAAALLMIPPHSHRGLHLQSTRRPRTAPAALACAAVGLVLASLAAPALAVVGTVALVLALSRRRAARQLRRRRQEGEAMAAALETVVGELRVGAHPLHAFGIAAAESRGSVGAALRIITARVGLGADVAAGLRAVSAESAVPFYWNRIAICWQLASDHGLAMATLMRAAQSDILERQRFGKRLHASLAGARATAAVLAGLPALGILLGELVGAHPMRFLLGGGAGSWLLTAGAVLTVTGVLWSDRIVNRLMS